MIEQATPASPDLLGGGADVLSVDGAPKTTASLDPLMLDRPMLDLRRAGWAVLCTGCALAAWGLVYALILIAV